jgi:hypothetical protein
MLMSNMFVTAAGNGWSAVKVPLELAAQRRRIFSLVLKVPVPLEDLTAPKFWTQAKDLKAGDRVEITLPSKDGMRPYSFILEVQSNVGATGAVMAPWPRVPSGLYDAQPHRTEEKPVPRPQLEHARA